MSALKSKKKQAAWAAAWPAQHVNISACVCLKEEKVHEEIKIKRDSPLTHLPVRHNFLSVHLYRGGGWGRERTMICLLPSSLPSFLPSFSPPLLRAGSLQSSALYLVIQHWGWVTKKHSAEVYIFIKPETRKPSVGSSLSSHCVLLIHPTPYSVFQMSSLYDWLLMSQENRLHEALHSISKTCLFRPSPKGLPKYLQTGVHGVCLVYKGFISLCFSFIQYKTQYLHNPWEIVFKKFATVITLVL